MMIIIVFVVLVVVVLMVVMLVLSVVVVVLVLLLGDDGYGGCRFIVLSFFCFGFFVLFLVCFYFDFFNVRLSGGQVGWKGPA